MAFPYSLRQYIILCDMKVEEENWEEQGEEEREAQ